MRRREENEENEQRHAVSRFSSFKIKKVTVIYLALSSPFQSNSARLGDFWEIMVLNAVKLFSCLSQDLHNRCGNNSSRSKEPP